MSLVPGHFPVAHVTALHLGCPHVVTVRRPLDSYTSPRPVIQTKEAHPLLTEDSWSPPGNLGQPIFLLTSGPNTSKKS